MSRVSQVAVKKRGGFSLMNRSAFLGLPTDEKKALLAAKQVEFIDEKGVPVPFMEGLKDLLSK